MKKQSTIIINQKNMFNKYMSKAKSMMPNDMKNGDHGLDD